MRWLRLFLLTGLGTLACTYNTYVVGGDGGASDADSGTPAPSINFFLQSVLAPPSGVGPGGCAFTSDPTQGTLSKGILDVEVVKSFSDTYEAEFLAGNQFAATGKLSNSQLDASRIVIQGAEVTVTDATGKQLASFMTLGSGFLNPSNGSTPGYGSFQLTIVDPATIDSLRAQLAFNERVTIVTHTQALGQTLGGQHVASNVFEFSITACKGCLIQFDTDNARTPIPNCYARAPVSAPGPSVCFYGQEDPSDCHVCIKDPFCLCGQATCK
jgi:hypothetical protein